MTFSEKPDHGSHAEAPQGTLLHRRDALKGLGAAGLIVSGGLRDVLAQGVAPALVTPDSARPQTPCGVMSGDVNVDRAIVWSRADRSSQLLVEWSTTEAMREVRRIVGPAAIESSDFTARVDLAGLPAGQTSSIAFRFRT